MKYSEVKEPTSVLLVNFKKSVQKCVTCVSGHLCFEVIFRRKRSLGLNKSYNCIMFRIHVRLIIS